MMSMPDIVTSLPLGARPRNSPLWVPRMVNRAETLSSSAIMSSTTKRRSGMRHGAPPEIPCIARGSLDRGYRQSRSGSRRRESHLLRRSCLCSTAPRRIVGQQPCFLLRPSQDLLRVRLDLFAWTVLQTMRESNPTNVGYFGMLVTYIMLPP